VILPTFLALALPLAALWRLLDRALRDMRLAFGLALLAWALVAVAISELASIGEHLTRPVVAVVWGLLAIVSLVVLLRVPRTTPLVLDVHGRWERAGLIAIGVIGVLTLATGLLAAPNNWDSMVYHLARVDMWTHLGGVQHYATHIEPQLYQPPGAELLILQGYVLGSTDALAAIAQWLAWAGCVVLAHRAAQALGAGSRGRMGAAVLAASCPLAILEASSTQNDLLLALWLLLATTCAAIAWRREGEGEGTDAGVSARTAGWLLLAASAAIGMAVLTKGTGLMFGAPVGVLIAAAAVRRVGPARAGALALVGAVLVALPNAGQWARNFETYGSIVAAEHAGLANPYRVQDPGAGSLVSNLVRNATNHLDVPFEPANDAIERATVRTLDALGIDANDPKTTFLAQPFRVGPFGPHEDHAGSMLLLVLGLWAIGSTILARRRREPGSGIQLAWLGVLAAQVLLFAWLITWQNWHVRMHLPVTIAVAVLVAVRLGVRRTPRALATVCAIAIVVSPLYVLANVTRPLIGEGSVLTSSRAATRFEPRPQLREPYAEVVRRARDLDVETVGLVSGIDDWQYPLLRELHKRGIDVRQVLVSGPSAKFADAKAPLPDVVICTGCTPDKQALLAAEGLAPVELDAGGPREGRGDDVATVELWVRDARG
jgi:hypothetical protein